MAHLLALLLLSLAAVAWLIAAVNYSLDTLSIVGLLAVTIGFGFAWLGVRTERRSWHAGGLAAAAVGMLMFLGPGLGSFAGPGLLASHIFALGIVAALVALFAGGPTLARVGWALAALATLVWVYNDRTSLAWQPGNIGAFVGAAWLAWKPSA